MRGWFSGPGVGVLDTRYLRLDAANDPVTAGLEVNAATTGEPVLILQTTDDDPTNPIFQIQDSAGAELTKIHTDNIRNLFIGNNAGIANVVGGGGAGQNNVFIGRLAGIVNTSGYSNVVVGSSAFVNNTTGFECFALGNGSLFSNTTGSRNVAVGQSALNACTTGLGNVAVGRNALTLLTTGQYNVGIGNSAMVSTNGTGNIAIGATALYNNATGSYNVGIGHAAMFNSSGVAEYNIALGREAQHFNVSGDNNICLGRDAQRYNQTGGNAVIIGHQAGRGTGAHNKSNNVMIGYQAGFLSQTADNNILIGYQAGNVLTTGDSNIIIGYDIDPTGAAVSNELNIGGLLYGDLANNMGGVNVTPPSLAAAWHVDQATDDAAIPVLLLDQADVDQEMIEFATTIGVGNAIEAVGIKVLTTTHFIKVTLPGGLTRYIPAGTIA